MESTFAQARSAKPRALAAKSERYDCELTDVSAIQDEIAAAIAGELLADLRDNVATGVIGFATYHLARGEVDRAVDWLGKAVEQRIPALPLDSDSSV